MDWFVNMFYLIIFLLLVQLVISIIARNTSGKKYWIYFTIMFLIAIINIKIGIIAINTPRELTNHLPSRSP